MNSDSNSSRNGNTISLAVSTSPWLWRDLTGNNSRFIPSSGVVFQGSQISRYSGHFWYSHEFVDKPKLHRNYKLKTTIKSDLFFHGIAVDMFGNIFTSVTHQLLIFRGDGAFVRCFASKGSTEGLVFFPGGLTFDLNGNLVLADTGNHRCQIFNASGILTSHQLMNIHVI